jgi:hypothetical protein
MRLVLRAACAVALVAGTTATAQRASAAIQTSGDAVVVAKDFKTPLRGGGSGDLFSLTLPHGASCPGDSVEGNYRVQSFMVPAVNDPGALRYRIVGPVADHGWALFTADTNSWTDQPTQKAAKSGGEGLVVDIPGFTFNVFRPGDLVPGRYHIGIACTLFGATKRFWSTDIGVSSDVRDKPAGIAWTVVNPPASTSSGAGGGRTWLFVGLVGVAALAGGGIVIRGRRR